MSSRQKRAYFSYSLTAVAAKRRRNFLAHRDAVREVCERVGIALHDPMAFLPIAEANVSPEVLYLRDRESIEASDAIILHCGLLSAGVVNELRIAHAANRPVVLLIPGRPGQPLPGLLAGTPDLTYRICFKTLRDLRADLVGALRLAFQLPDLAAERSPQFPRLIEVVGSINACLLEHLREHPEDLYRLKPRVFEEIIAEMLSSFGWKVEITPTTKDGGYDIFAISKEVAPGVRTPWLIECKRYASERRVGVEIVRALYGVKASFPGVHAMLATTSFFTRGAQEFKASRYDLHLRDYNGIVDWLRAYRVSPSGTLFVPETSRNEAA